MKRLSYTYRGAVIGTVLSCLLFVGDYASGKSAATARTSVAAQTVNEPARLVIRRIPNLGNHVIVDVYLDGQPYTSVVYGQTFEGSLPAGKHVLSVLATPSPRYPTKTDVVLNARSGETYTFTAMGDQTGSLTLQPLG